jgi:uncharacterized protein YuzE
MGLESDYPDIQESKNSIDIAFYPRSHRKKTVNIEFVLDIDRFSNIIGIEIINLKYHLGKDSLELLGKNGDTVGTRMRCSYDTEADVFYLQLSNEYSSDQLVVDGKLYLDDNGHVIGVEVDKLVGWVEE